MLLSSSNSRQAQHPQKVKGKSVILDRSPYLKGALSRRMLFEMCMFHRVEVDTARDCLNMCKTQNCGTWIMAGGKCYLDDAEGPTVNPEDEPVLGIAGTFKSKLPGKACEIALESFEQKVMKRKLCLWVILVTDYEIYSCNQSVYEKQAKSLEECRDFCMESDEGLGWSYQGGRYCECSKYQDEDIKSSLCGDT